MGWNKWQENGTKLFDSGFIVQAFHIITTSILTLLLPLSFLLLSGLSNANYLLSLASSSQTLLYSASTVLIFDITPTIFYTLIFLVSMLSLINAFTSQSQKPNFHLPLYVSWFLLSMFQVCVRLVIEGGVAFGINESGVSHEISLTSRVAFFLGLHETMTYWSRMVVKPVVDDTILGFRKEEMWAESVVVAVGFGGLLWWRLRDEVEILVIMVELKKELMMDVGVCDFIAFSLYYLTVVIGLVKFAKLVIWFVIVFKFERVEANPCKLSGGNDEKV